jgi:hypothetical protein
MGGLRFEHGAIELLGLLAGSLTIMGHGRFEKLVRRDLTTSRRRGGLCGICGIEFLRQRFVRSIAPRLMTLAAAERGIGMI